MSVRSWVAVVVGCAAVGAVIGYGIGKVIVLVLGALLAHVSAS